MSSYNWHLFTARPLTDPQYSSLLQRARMQAQLSQRELALVVGLARPTVSRIETGHQRVRPETAQGLATAFGCPLDALFAPLAGKRKTTAGEAALPPLLPTPPPPATLTLLTLAAWKITAPTAAAGAYQKLQQRLSILGLLVRLMPPLREFWPQVSPALHLAPTPLPTPVDLWRWARRVPDDALDVFIERAPTTAVAQVIVQNTFPPPGGQAVKVLTALGVLVALLPDIHTVADPLAALTAPAPIRVAISAP